MTVCCRCDNAAVVAILRSGTSKHTLVMYILRCLFFFVVYYKIYLDPVHLLGRCKLLTVYPGITFLVSCSWYQQLKTCPHPSSRTVRSTGAQDSQLDVRHMDDRAVFYFAKELASSTIRTYRSSQERFLKYCQSTNSVPFPVTEVVLCGFATHLADVGLKHRSIKTYMSGVRFFFRLRWGPVPGCTGAGWRT